jgi:hypothetical protein
MHYLLTPLHTHIDFGFGATGDAFKTAADRLETAVSPRAGVLNEHLPINYLRRHAIELFLKSAIVIIHRRLRLPYGSSPFSGEPHALVEDRWVPFLRLHSVKLLWAYLAALFRDHKSFFDTVERVDWTFPPEMNAWIEEIDAKDPRSTFFRYPTPRDTEADASKAVMAEGTQDEIMARLAARGEDSPKEFILLLENEVGHVTRGYYYAGNSLASFNKVLENCVDIFYGMHAALRSEVCGGA